METTDYSWCFRNNNDCNEINDTPSACTGFDICGCDGCAEEFCGFDCGKDCGFDCYDN